MTKNIKEVRVLLVDDMQPMRFLINAYLSRIGVSNVTEAINGEIALRFLQNKNFDLVICEWDMPVMNGLDLLKVMRNDPRLQHQKFIMLTAHTSAELVREAIAAGVTDYIVKPFTLPVYGETSHRWIHPADRPGVD